MMARPAPSRILLPRPYQEGTTPVRVLIVDDHDGFRAALASAVALVEGMDVAGEASSGEEAVEVAVALRPDVIIMDLSMPGISGIEATRRIRRRLPGMPVVILTAHADPAIGRDARAAGAAGFVPKGSSFEALIQVVREAGGGEAANPDTEDMANGA
jgi:DNA-binding NarL/FixJ family response regulator